MLGTFRIFSGILLRSRKQALLVVNREYAYYNIRREGRNMLTRRRRSADSAANAGDILYQFLHRFRRVVQLVHTRTAARSPPAAARSAEGVFLPKSRSLGGGEDGKLLVGRGIIKQRGALLFKGPANFPRQLHRGRRWPRSSRPPSTSQTECPGGLWPAFPP